VIVDEAQNLTPYQAKMLMTRAGDGAKFVFCGNLAQIDTPYLDEKGSGLTNIVMNMRGDKHVAHVILRECVRSRLAALAVARL
jgi:PhoH-like ATPase